MADSAAQSSVAAGPSGDSLAQNDDPDPLVENDERPSAIVETSAENSGAAPDHQPPPAAPAVCRCHRAKCKTCRMCPSCHCLCNGPPVRRARGRPRKTDSTAPSRLDESAAAAERKRQRPAARASAIRAIEAVASAVNDTPPEMLMDYDIAETRGDLAQFFQWPAFIRHSMPPLKRIKTTKKEDFQKHHWKALVRAINFSALAMAKILAPKAKEDLVQDAALQITGPALTSLRTQNKMLRDENATLKLTIAKLEQKQHLSGAKRKTPDASGGSSHGGASKKSAH